MKSLTRKRIETDTKVDEKNGSSILLTFKKNTNTTLKAAIKQSLSDNLEKINQYFISSQNQLIGMDDTFLKLILNMKKQTVVLGNELDHVVELIEIEKRFNNLEVEYSLKNPSCLKPDNVIYEEALIISQKYGRLDDVIVELSSASIAIPTYYLRIAIREIIDNAFNYSLSGSPVKITTQIDKNEYVIKVTDKGKGIKESKIDELMHIENLSDDVVGLGLLLVRKVMNHFDSKVSIFSIPNRETTVTVSISLREFDF